MCSITPGLFRFSFLKRSLPVLWSLSPSSFYLIAPIHVPTDEHLLCSVVTFIVLGLLLSFL